MPATLSLTSDLQAITACPTLLVIGRKERLLREDVLALVSPVPRGVWEQMVLRNEPGDRGRAITTHTEGTPTKVVAGLLPEACSRHNSPSRSWAIPSLVAAAGLMGDVGIVLAVDDLDHAFAATLAVARAHPSFSATSTRIEREARLLVLDPQGKPLQDTQRLQVAADALRFAADLVDQPPNTLTTTALVEVARQVAARHAKASIYVVQGQQLADLGLGGIWGVGKAARNPPALVALDLAGPRDAPRVSWVGKGIVYDTGGLSIKSKTGMPGMKTDMGGAAAVLAAFDAAARLDLPMQLTAVLCVAENAVGPDSLRPDDVLTLYSGKTVEVNNTDAEGRLVLGDGVAWAARHRSPSLLIDLATLTGAQSVATGKRTAALYCNDDALEARAVAAGRAAGELVHPLPYIPEFFKREFSSQVADMRNSVKDRSNAQSSCAGQFIANHLDGARYKGPWLHVDLAGPAVDAGRGTGFGVGLLLALAGLASGAEAGTSG